MTQRPPSTTRQSDESLSSQPAPARAAALWSHPRVTITPHVAAVSLPDDVAEVFAANFRKFLDGEPLDFVVDWERGY